jgi:hypothetical protein
LKQKFNKNQINGPDGVDHRHDVDDEVGEHCAVDGHVPGPHQSNEHFHGPDGHIEGRKNGLEKTEKKFALKLTLREKYIKTIKYNLKYIKTKNCLKIEKQIQ